MTAPNTPSQIAADNSRHSPSTGLGHPDRHVGRRRHFEEDGFLIVERLLDSEQIQDLRSRFSLLFAGKFDTGIYPDEWYWREGMSLPDVTRHMPVPRCS